MKPYDLTARAEIDGELTARAIAFSEAAAAADAPFFVSLPCTRAHLPAIPHPDFAGRTGNRRWADMLAEMDHRAGDVLDAIDRLGLRDDTVVIWTSDNGPEEAPGHSGAAG